MTILRWAFPSNKLRDVAHRRQASGHDQGNVTMPNTAAPALIVRDVVKSYGRRQALDHVSLAVRPGEFVVLLGPNGAGKTTLFQLLSGLFTPDAGQVEVMGHDMARNAVPALAGLGIVFQQPTLDPELSVGANLRFHAGLHGLPRKLATARIAAELERIGLADRALERARTLSGGNKRKVELARALLHEPRVLLMDEPTVGLDPASRRDLIRLVLKVRDESQMAILWATHLCEEAVNADRIIVLHHGKVLRDTTPAGLLEESGATLLEEAFIGLIGGQAEAAA
jgi:ABC-2 type transport system ATP-binding protein